MSTQRRDTLPHIIDVLIEERAGAFARWPRTWRALRTALDPLLGYRHAVRLADTLAMLDGVAAFDHLASELALHCEVEGIERVPASGPVLLVANHPTGIADGVALWTALRAHRRDLVFFANRDAVRVSPGLAQTVIPVEWVVARRTRGRARETLRAAERAFADNRAVVMFPSGRLAWRARGGWLRERRWLNTAVALAERRGVAMVPIGIRMRNSALFYAFSRLADPLRDITLFHELLNKRGAQYTFRIGSPLSAGWSQRFGTTAEATRWLQGHVEHDLAGPIHVRARDLARVPSPAGADSNAATRSP